MSQKEPENVRTKPCSGGLSCKRWKEKKCWFAHTPEELVCIRCDKEKCSEDCKYFHTHDTISSYISKNNFVFEEISVLFDRLILKSESLEEKIKEWTRKFHEEEDEDARIDMICSYPLG